VKRLLHSRECFVGPAVPLRGVGLRSTSTERRGGRGRRDSAPGSRVLVDFPLRGSTDITSPIAPRPRKGMASAMARRAARLGFPARDGVVPTAPTSSDPGDEDRQRRPRQSRSGSGATTFGTQAGPWVTDDDKVAKPIECALLRHRPSCEALEFRLTLLHSARVKRRPIARPVASAAYVGDYTWRSPRCCHARSPSHGYPAVNAANS